MNMRKHRGAPPGNTFALKHGLRTAERRAEAAERFRFYTECQDTIARITELCGRPKKVIRRENNHDSE